MINQFTDIFNKFAFQIGHGHGLFMFIILHSLKFRIFRKIRKCKSEMDCRPNKIMFIMIFQCDILLRCNHIIHFAIDTNEIQWNALHCISLLWIPMEVVQWTTLCLLFVKHASSSTTSSTSPLLNRYLHLLAMHLWRHKQQQNEQNSTWQRADLKKHAFVLFHKIHIFSMSSFSWNKMIETILHIFNVDSVILTNCYSNSNYLLLFTTKWSCTLHRPLSASETLSHTSTSINSA